jgi:hypothetical protein
MSYAAWGQGVHTYPDIDDKTPLSPGLDPKDTGVTISDKLTEQLDLAFTKWREDKSPAYEFVDSDGNLTSRKVDDQAPLCGPMEVTFTGSPIGDISDKISYSDWARGTSGSVVSKDFGLIGSKISGGSKDFGHSGDNHHERTTEWIGKFSKHVYTGGMSNG